MKVMPPAVRKTALVIHIISSVGWLGAIAGFLALAVAGLTAADPQLARAMYLGMNLIGWTIIFPLSLASLVTGVVQALGTVWGLFRHYWVECVNLIGAHQDGPNGTHRKGAPTGAHHAEFAPQPSQDGMNREMYCSSGFAHRHLIRA